MGGAAIPEHIPTLSEPKPPGTRNGILRDARALVTADDTLGALLLLAVESTKASGDGALRLEYAKTLRLAGRHAEALATLDEFSAIAPDFEGLAAAHGAALDKLGQTEAAAVRYAAAIAARQVDRESRHRLASCLRRLGRPAEGQAAIEDGLAITPRNPALLLESARCLADLGQLEAAMAALDILAEDKPDHPRLPDARTAVTKSANGRRARDWLDRVRVRQKAGDPAGSLALLEEAALAIPANGTIRIEQAKLLRHFARHEEALAVLEALALREPRHGGLAAEMALTFEKLGRETEAIEAYGRALAAKREDRLARRNLASCLRRLGRMDEAQATLEEGLEIAPRDSLLLLQQVRLLADLGRLEGAEAALAIVAADKPDHSGLLEMRLVLAQLRGDVDAATEAYRLALLASPGSAKLCGQYVRALGRADRASEALEVLRGFLDIAPENPGLSLDLVGLLIRSADVEEAHRVLDGVRLSHPENPRLHDVAARLAETEGDHARAAEALRAALLADPGNTGLQVRLIRALRRMHALDEVLLALKAYAQETPSIRFELAAELLALGDWEEAGNVIAAWCPKDPQDDVAKQQAEALQAALAFDHRKAVALSRSILEIAPDNGWAAARLVASLAFSFEAQQAYEAHMARQLLLPLRQRKNPLRTTAGHIFNEFRLRRGETETLAAAFDRPGNELAQAAAPLLAADRDSTGAALALMIGLNRGGCFAASAGSCGGSRRVPRLLHQYWDREKPPTDIEALVAVLRDRNGDHEYRRWSDASARDFLKRHEMLEVLAAYHVARHVAAQADIFRLAVLLVEGGVYVDADDYCRRPLEALIPDEANLVLHQEDLGSVANNFIAAAPGHPLLREALADACEAIRAGAGESPWLSSGPGLMTRVIGRAVVDSGELRLPPGVQIHRLRAYRKHISPGRYLAYKRTTQHWSLAL